MMEIATPTAYGMNVTVGLTYEKAIERVTEALAQEGFGILTEIDVRATLHRKIGVDFSPYIILGACNPSLAHAALSEERDIGLLLPCNVIVYGNKDGSSTVAAIDPVAQLGVVGREEIQPLAVQVKEKLERALAVVAT